MMSFFFIYLLISGLGRSLLMHLSQARINLGVTVKINTAQSEVVKVTLVVRSLETSRLLTGRASVLGQNLKPIVLPEFFQLFYGLCKHISKAALVPL